jgi:hypothetical protein
LPKYIRILVSRPLPPFFNEVVREHRVRRENLLFPA